MPARTATLLTAALLAWAMPAAAHARKAGHHPRGLSGAILLDGQPARVRWIDGDTIRVESGPLTGATARLSGFDTLETWGPVHRIGQASPEALLRVALAAAPRLAGTEWRCTTLGLRDGYGRALVDCPEAALALVREGLAMVFAVDGPADPALLAAQQEAQAARAGLWSGGVPPRIPTNLHSAGEDGQGRRGPADRVADTRTGRATLRPHQHAYQPCQVVCLGDGPLAACMTYVPPERRHRDRPACLGP